MKKRTILSGVLSAAVVSSLVVFPSFTNAQGTSSTIDVEKELINAKKHEIHRLLENQPKGSSKVSTKSVTAKSMTSATYTGSISGDTVHFYYFKVTEAGTLNVETNILDQYVILNPNDPDAVPPMDGETIQPGEYVLIVFGMDETPQDYSLTLSGFTFTGDTTLPELNITSPKDVYTRLAKGSKAVTVSGSTTGAEKAGMTVDGEEEIQNLNIPSFSKSVPVHLGFNELFLSAQNSSLNQVVKDRAVLAPGVERMAGADRYITSAEIAKRLPVTSDTVVIATGTNFPDALSGGALASWEGAPILLTKSTGLSSAVKAEITRRGATRAILLGGVDVVSKTVENDLRALGVNTIDRQEGIDRYETSAKIADTLLKKQEEETGGEFHSNTAFIVTGTNYADALAASAPAGAMGAPILLVKGSSATIPAAIQKVIQDQGINEFYVVGGSDVVSDSIYKQLDGYGTVKRLSGTDRYKTALAVAKEFTMKQPVLAPSNVHVAYGGNYPDALAQGPLASMMGAPLLLTKTGSLDSEVASYLQLVQPDVFYISGGADVVSTTVENQLKSYIPE